ncbi:hypothetical protein ABKN59_009113 [Abortiporus biennis]
MSSKSSSPSILKLSLELLRDSFEYLNYKELGQASQVWLAEGPSAGKLSLCSKQDRLRRYQKAWQSPSFRKHTLPKNPSRVFVPVVNSQCCEGVEAYILTGLRDIEFTLLGSPLNGIQERKWTIHLDFEAENFCICPSEDLLVVIFAHPAQSTARRPINYGVHHLRMSSGEHHENAFLFQDPIHPFPFSKYLMVDEAECIASGSYVGMSINAWGAETETGIRGALFMMWNWRTGVVLWDNSRSSQSLHPDENIPWYEGHCFLDDHHLLLDRSWITRADSMNVDFEADKSASIIALQMSFYKDPDRDSDDDDDDIQPVHHTFQLFIHTYKMLQLHAYFSSQNMQTVPWDLWGPNNTRITNIFPHTSSVFGTRVVIAQEFFKFLDFNVAPLSSDIQTRNAHGNSGLISETGYRVNGIFLDDNLTSSLPFHLTLTQVRYDFVVGEAVMLNADTILIYNRPTSDLHRDESVFTLENNVKSCDYCSQ